MAGMNPMQIMGLLKARNPQAAVMQLLQGNSDPMIQNLVQMANQDNSQGIQQFAQNYFNQMGRDFNSEMSSFMQMIGKM